MREAGRLVRAVINIVALDLVPSVGPEEPSGPEKKLHANVKTERFVFARLQRNE